MLAVRVVKLGGNELERPEWLAECACALKRSEPVLVVHGGGRAVDALSRRLGLPVEKREGVRVTTPEVAEAVELALAGPINRQVVSALRRAGLDALGLSGVDGGLLTAAVAPGGGGLGHVGEITAVRTSLLQSLLSAGLTPVVVPLAPAGADAGGVPLNVNADHAAAAIAGALRARELLFISDVAGVEVDGAVQSSLAIAEIDGLIGRGVAAGGMAAKLRAAAAALRAGAKAVRIGDLAMLDHPSVGTRILAATPHPQPA